MNGGALHFDVSSKLVEVDGICREVRRLMTREGLESQVFSIDLLLREFLNNAMFHGNRLDPGKRVQASIRIGRKWITLRVVDEGPGFRWRVARNVPPAEEATSGRGLAIGRQYSERMRFNRKGNGVTLWVKKAF